MCIHGSPWVLVLVIEADGASGARVRWGRTEAVPTVSPGVVAAMLSIGIWPALFPFVLSMAGGSSLLVASVCIALIGSRGNFC